MVDRATQHSRDEAFVQGGLPESIHRVAEIISRLLTPGEITSVCARLQLYDTAPFLSYHGLRNCGGHDWWRCTDLNMISLYRIYAIEGLLCGDLRRERAAIEPTAGRVSCSSSCFVDYRSRSAELVRRDPKNTGKGRFPPVDLDSFWGFPEFPTMIFSLEKDREEYRGADPDKIPKSQHERGVAEVTRSEFIALCLCGEGQVASFYREAGRYEKFSYDIPILCGREHIALPDLKNTLTDKPYYLIARADFEQWYSWATEPGARDI